MSGPVLAIDPSGDRIAVAFDAAIGHLADDGDRRALVLALVEHMPPEGVAELLARLIEGHPEGAGLVRLLVAGVPSARVLHLMRLGSRGPIGWLDGATVRPGPGHYVESHPTQEAAEAALIAAQPVSAAVVRVRE